MTVAADNYIYVTGDLTYKDKATDVLGLVGQQRGVRLEPGARHRLQRHAARLPDTWTGMI